MFDTKTSKCSKNGRSAPVCNKHAYITPRQQQNALSAYIDGSQIYSNDPAHYEKLREHAGKDVEQIEQKERKKSI